MELAGQSQRLPPVIAVVGIVLSIHMRLQGSKTVVGCDFDQPLNKEGLDRFASLYSPSAKVSATSQCSKVVSNTGTDTLL
jgi:hypothetical protein